MVVYILLWGLTGIAGKYNNRDFQTLSDMTTMRICFISWPYSYSHAMNEYNFYKILLHYEQCTVTSLLFYFTTVALTYSLKKTVAMSAHLGPWGETVVTAAKTSVLESDWG